MADKVEAAFAQVEQAADGLSNEDRIEFFNAVGNRCYVASRAAQEDREAGS